MIQTILIFALLACCLALLCVCFWLVQQNGLLRERLYDAEEALELAPIPWGKEPNLRSWGEEGDDE
jgi:hypothetical protein